MSAKDCSPDCSCMPSPSEPGKTFCAFVDKEKGHTRPCKAECCKNTCTGSQPGDTDSQRMPFGFGVNLPISEKPSVQKWVRAFESDPVYMHEIVTSPGTYTDPQIVKPYPLVMSSKRPERPVVEQVDNGPLITFIGTMAVTLALLM